MRGRRGRPARSHRTDAKSHHEFVRRGSPRRRAQASARSAEWSASRSPATPPPSQERRIDDVYCGDARADHRAGETRSSTDHRRRTSSSTSTIRWTSSPTCDASPGPAGGCASSIRNISHAAVVDDRLAGRFDYVYMGHGLRGHRALHADPSRRCFDRTGWSVEKIEPQRGARRRRESLTASAGRVAGFPSRARLLAPATSDGAEGSAAHTIR